LLDACNVTCTFATNPTINCFDLWQLGVIKWGGFETPPSYMTRRLFFIAIKVHIGQNKPGNKNLQDVICNLGDIISIALVATSDGT
jgi:hypothetical protein